jgi:hypothetical protein
MRPGGEVNWLQLRDVPHACDELPTDPKAPCSIDILWVLVFPSTFEKLQRFV